MAVTKVRGEGSGRIDVREELEWLLRASGSADVFLHGLFAFLSEASKRERTHPLVESLHKILSDAAAARFMSAAMHDLSSMMQVASTHIDLMKGTAEAIVTPGMDPDRELPGLIAQLLEGIEDAKLAADVGVELLYSAAAVNQGLSTREPVAPIHEAMQATWRVFQRRSRRLPPVTMEEENVRTRVKARKAELVRVLFNLVRNACDAAMPKHGGRQDRPYVGMSSWMTDENVFVQVADNGPGIPPAAVEQMFDLFYTTKPDGSGIGLYIVRSLVEGWGGKLEVSPRDGGGAQFVFSVPRVGD